MGDFLKDKTDNKPPIYNYSFKYITILLHDDLDEFIKIFDDIGFDIFVIISSIYYRRGNKIINFLIEKNFGLNHITSDRTSGFTYLFYNYVDDYKIINDILDKNILPRSFFFIRDIFGNLPLDYIELSTITDENSIFVQRIFEMSSEVDVSYSELKTFNFNEFEIIEYKKDFKGTYGEISHVIHKETGKHMSIKKFNLDILNYDQLHQTIMKEISFLHFINKLNPHLAVILYGLIYENNSIYLVQEYMFYTLYDQLKILIKLPNSEIQIKKLVYELLLLVDELNGMGILHCDIKENNIMFDENGRMKLIDFGISEYIGLLPTKGVSTNSILSNYNSPDTSQLKCNILIDNKKIEVYASDLKSLNNDTFSIGMLFLKYTDIFKKDRLYFTCFDELYKEQFTISEGRKFKKIQMNNSDLNKFLYKLIEFERRKRPFPKEALNDKFFTGIEIDKVESKNFNKNSIYHLKNHFPCYGPTQKELFYKDDIFNSIILLKFRETPVEIESNVINEKMFLILSEWLLETTFMFKYNLNVYFNAINLIRIISNSVDKRSNYQGYGIVCLAIYTYIFEYFPPDYDDYCYICDKAYSVNYLKNLTSDIINKKITIKNDYNLFEFVPIMSYIGYISSKLQELDIVENEIRRIITLLLFTVAMYINLNKKSQLLIWDVIRYGYKIYKEELPDLDILFDINELDYEYIKSIIDNQPEEFGKKILNHLNKIY